MYIYILNYIKTPPPFFCFLYSQMAYQPPPPPGHHHPYTRPEGPPFQCPFCTFRHYGRGQLEQHLSARHLQPVIPPLMENTPRPRQQPAIPEPQPVPIIPATPLGFPCPVPGCAYRGTRQAGLTMHLKTHAVNQAATKKRPPTASGSYKGLTSQSTNARKGPENYCQTIRAPARKLAKPATQPEAKPATQPEAKPVTQPPTKTAKPATQTKPKATTTKPKPQTSTPKSKSPSPLKFNLSISSTDSSHSSSSSSSNNSNNTSSSSSSSSDHPATMITVATQTSPMKIQFSGGIFTLNFQREKEQ